MSWSGAVMNLLYVDRDGLVRSGRLASDAQPEGEGPAVLIDRGGRTLRPTDVLALLEPRHAREDERAAFCRAAQAGYRVEVR
jgi:hypothetical protein